MIKLVGFGEGIFCIGSGEASGLGVVPYYVK